MLLIEYKYFYIYIYLNPLKPGNYNYLYGNVKLHFDFSPFYVGRGQKHRMYMHLYEAKTIREKIENESLNKEEEKYNKHKINTINKILRHGKEPIILKLNENLNNNEVNELERFYISLIGRADKKLGPLTNQSDGGDGQSGYIHTLETRKKMSLAGKDKKQSEKHIENRTESRKNNGKEWHTKETKQKIGDGNRNKKLSSKHVEILRLKAIGRNNPKAKKYIIITLEGKEIFLHGEFCKFCRENHISSKKLKQTIKKEIDNYKGYKLIDLN